MINGQVDGGKDFRRNFIMLVGSTCLHRNQRRELNYLIVNALADLRKEFVIGFGKGYLEDTLDKMTIIDEEEEVNEEERHNRNVIFSLTISIVRLNHALSRDGKMTTDLIITNSQLQVEMITELEELILGACTPLKRVRKVVAKSTSDALIIDRPNKSKSRRPILL
ncbi:hypothetical protein Cgig2_011761 [Carnegiea gigantea]|uniref:Uncharacterized protein n=1 Tax=Carnegiea gigantea TaxID=171969 RepID=A0A9Q1GPU9_9CARY|nr:hypothetical protein Cgig2_011761 [Carnegiea gigantea]